MKRYIHLFPFLFIIGPLAWSWFHSGFHQNHDKSDKIMFCKNVRRTSSSPLNYIGPNLISNSHDSIDQVLCSGDYFGDLNNTYVTIKKCSLEMYHRDKMIWSSKLDPMYQYVQETNGGACAFSLQRDGNLVLYQEKKENVIFSEWESRTHTYPLKAELRVQNQQMQIVQAFEDKTERLFYVDAENQEFREDMGEPKKVANRFILKRPEDEDPTILRRNEYIGDLDGTHLILQINCSLQLVNKNKSLWSYDPHFTREKDCVFETFDFIFRQSGVVITIIDNSHGQRSLVISSILRSDPPSYSHVLETWITFEDDQPLIIQTLSNGTELTFTGEVGQNERLKLKRKRGQLAEKTLDIPDRGFEMEKMDYIGNLTGLHLILDWDCQLVLNNGNQKLWELQADLEKTPPVKCSIQFERSGDISFGRQYDRFFESDEIISAANYNEGKFLAGYQLTLEYNQVILRRQFTDRPPDIYIAGPKTRGTFFQVISKHSVVVNHDDNEDRILPKEGFIGDINGVYAMFEEDCNMVLYNKIQVIWESGTSGKGFNGDCVLVLKRNGSLMITQRWEYRREDYFWSTHNLTTDPEKEVLRTKLLVSDGGLWLMNTYMDGTGKIFKALEGTNGFVHVTN